MRSCPVRSVAVIIKNTKIALKLSEDDGQSEYKMKLNKSSSTLTLVPVVQHCLSLCYKTKVAAKQVAKSLIDLSDSPVTIFTM